MTRPQDRAVHLAEVQRLKMARSAHAYVRGSTVKFYEWFASGPANIPDGPMHGRQMSERQISPEGR
jgi:uncharacterized protein (DUF2252 family)